MLQHSSTALVGFTSLIAVASVLIYVQFREENKGTGEKKSEKNTFKAKSYSDTDEGNRVNNDNEIVHHVCKSMLDYNDKELVERIIDMADQRGKRWVSVRVSGAHCMVGQVGGKSQRKRPFLILDRFVMKPISLDHRGIREIAFYESIQAASKRSCFQKFCSLVVPRVHKEKILPCDEARDEIETKLLYQLEPFTAKYFGTIEYNQNFPLNDRQVISATNPGPFGLKFNSYILLHDVTNNFSKPSVLDVKLGTESFEPDSSEEKKSYELKKYPSQSIFGFRLTAMRIYDPSNAKADFCGYVYYPKQFGRSLGTREALKQALIVFLGGVNLPKVTRANRSNAIQKIISRLRMIKTWFRDNKSFSFYGSSILIIYESETVRNEVCRVELDMARAEMIDFGRVRRRTGGDPGYLKGLTTLIDLLQEILKESFLGI